MAQSFTRALDKVIELAPDVVLIGGDVFHQVRPTNTAILHAYLQFVRLRNALPPISPPNFSASAYARCCS